MGTDVTQRGSAAMDRQRYSSPKQKFPWRITSQYPIESILYLRKGKLDNTSRLSNAGLLRSAHSVVTSADEGLTSGVHGK